MRSAKSNFQLGIGSLETLLIIVILAIAGFAGWYVYESNKKANNSYSNASQVSNSQVASSKSKPAATTFTFKEYGVKITLPDSLKGLSYTAKQIDNGDGTKSTDLFLNSPSLAKAMDDCSDSKVAHSGNFAALNKASGQFPANGPSEEVGSLLKQFDNFYISASYPNGNYCDVSDKEATVSAQAQALQKDLVNAFKTAQLV